MNKLNPLSENTVNQGFITLKLEMKTPGDSDIFQKKLKSVLPELYPAAELMGTIHYFRFIQQTIKVFLLILEHDGEQEPFLIELAKYFGPSLDELMIHVLHAPAAPLSENAEKFAQWAKAHNLSSFTTYAGYKGISVRKIKSMASEAGISVTSEKESQLPLLWIMPIKSRFSLAALKLILKPLTGFLYKGADEVGTVHFARLTKLSDSEIGFFTAYDGPIEKYAQDFCSKLGPAFDLMFKFIIDPPPSPASKNFVPFYEWAIKVNWLPIGFYSAYPGLSVQDIKALVLNENQKLPVSK